MIKTIRAENIFNVVDGLLGVDVFSRKPDESATPADTFVHIGIVSDNVSVNSNRGYLASTARVSFTIVCKQELLAADTEERVLYDVIDTINNAIVNEGCAKIPNWDNEFLINSIVETSASPIFTDDMNRAYIVKDYLFKYMAL